MASASPSSRWIDLQDVLLGKVTPPKAPPRTEADFGLPRPPPFWASAQEVLVLKHPAPRQTWVPPRIQRPEAEGAAKAPPPPEAGLTVEQAVAEVYAPVNARGPVLRALGDMAEETHEALQRGAMAPPMAERTLNALEEIALQWHRQADGVAKWYLENCFRLFENPPSIMRKL
ncbi:MAG: hypothetical protein HQL82_14695 [Magnetococcales bacterium]|nr:hypothetical protein [Magnetococcales bacterium]